MATASPADETRSLKDAFKEHFPIGAAINRSHATGQSDGRRTLDQIGQEVALIQTHFNQITAENDMKWVNIHPRQGADGYDFGQADAFVSFGEKHGLERVGHTLVWHNQTPDWVFAGKIPPPEAENVPAANSPGNMRPIYAGPRASREELLKTMRDHIHAVVGRYKGKVKTWDVVNEAIADGPPEKYLRDSLWLQIIGPDYIAKAFEFAHEADPDAILRYNDYGLENPVKAQKLVKLVQELQAQKVPIHVIGTQAHLNVSDATFESMDRSLTELRVLGLPIHITELDINSAKSGQNRTDAEVSANASATQGGLVSEAEQQLSRAYESVFRAIMKHRDSVKMVTFWGVNDAVSWRRDGRPLLFDGDNKPKPAFDAVMRVAKEPPAITLDLTPLHDAARVLENPHKGWYHHYPDNHINRYQIAQDADLLDFPGMDHLYIRLAWAYLEPKEGQYDWPLIDRMIEKWTAHGLGIAFRISCKETSTDRIEQQFATPRWVMEAGAQGGHYKMGKPIGPEGPWEPIYDDPIFLEKLERFLAAFAARYDGQPWLRYVDIGSIGDWGEGHSWASSRKTLSYGVRKLHIDLHLKHFKRSQLIISDDYVHALPDATERENLHRYILEKGISYRDDSIMVVGNFSQSSERFTVRSPEYFADAYPTKPTVLELDHYHKVKELGDWEARPGSAAHEFGNGKSGPDFFRGAIDLLRATYIGYHGDAREWLTDNPKLTGELLNRCGYWLFPTSITLPQSCSAGTSMPLAMGFENRGVAPPYAAYELRVKLTGKNTQFVQVVESNTKSWLPGAPIHLQTTLNLPADLKVGTYDLSIGLFDVKSDQVLPVEFAVDQKSQDDDGYFRVSALQISMR